MKKRKRKNRERAMNPEIHVSYPFFGISEKSPSRVLLRITLHGELVLCHVSIAMHDHCIHRLDSLGLDLSSFSN